ncbi:MULTISPECIES: phage baseplate assembly protein V [unclassified Shinella]|uniref:phage baseplate assembly protein V n=1 Tax=unclassified Shinella TaxID=2643062 RepID=UPI00234FA493|nr:MULTISPECIES: phage baseplate assembly protein V [unclassified Shinella]MCO5153379.1 phage baseplate assembly protein V [Shinella sp.]MDC7260558.1 phage baseplate assembly protein V [Shinella sp. HY16]MDC7267453.1 phage baseplate assembly protein V [Shinella sp. YZ44]
MIPKTPPEQIADIYHQLAEIRRRGRNRRRTGRIVEGPDDQGRYRVEVAKPNGKPFLSRWSKPRTLAAGGAKIDVVFSVGEQVDLVSESGDLTDAVIEMSTYSDQYARENAGNVPLHIKIGGTVIQAGGESVVITASKIVLDGEVHLGGEGGKLLHRKGDLDSDGDAAEGSATRVYAV